MYKYFIKPLFFLFAPEKIHYVAMDLLQLTVKIPFGKSILRGLFKVNDPRLERELFGIKFPNPVGLAAGFDKNATFFDAMDCLGFGFIEVGTVTPKGQPGNPKPRLFRLPDDNGLINRMGFNNEGVEAMVKRLKKRSPNIIVGGNIGKNKVTPNEDATADYEYCFEALFDYVDYFVVNVSSPNTPGLRELQEKEPLTRLLSRLQEMNHRKPTPKPILLKIAPDLTDQQLDDVVEIVQDTKLAGLIAANTTISRDGLKSPASLLSEAGGVSGQPVKERSTEVIRYIANKSKGSFPIIGVGGIQSGADAKEKLDAGASLVQVYTGFIYEGPALAKRINQYLLR